MRSIKGQVEVGDREDLRSEGIRGSPGIYSPAERFRNLSMLEDKSSFNSFPGSG